MLTSRLRPLTAEERAILQRLASVRSIGNDLGGAGCVTMLLFAPALILLDRLDLERWQPAAGAVALMAGLATMLYMRRSAGLGEVRRRYANDLRDGVAEEITYDAVEVIRVEEFEDLGANYYLRLADGRVLFLTGQYLDDLESRFPCAKFTRTVAPTSGLLFNLECLGPHLPVTSTRPAFTRDDYRSGRVPADGAIIQSMPASRPS